MNNSDLNATMQGLSQGLALGQQARLAADERQYRIEEARKAREHESYLQQRSLQFQRARDEWMRPLREREVAAGEVSAAAGAELSSAQALRTRRLTEPEATMLGAQARGIEIETEKKARTLDSDVMRAQHEAAYAGSRAAMAFLDTKFAESTTDVKKAMLYSQLRQLQVGTNLTEQQIAEMVQKIDQGKEMFPYQRAQAAALIEKTRAETRLAEAQAMTAEAQAERYKALLPGERRKLEADATLAGARARHADELAELEVQYNTRQLALIAAQIRLAEANGKAVPEQLELERQRLASDIASKVEAKYDRAIDRMMSLVTLGYKAALDINMADKQFAQNVELMKRDALIKSFAQWGISAPSDPSVAEGLDAMIGMIETLVPNSVPASVVPGLILDFPETFSRMVRPVYEEVMDIMSDPSIPSQEKLARVKEMSRGFEAKTQADLSSLLNSATAPRAPAPAPQQEPMAGQQPPPAQKSLTELFGKRVKYPTDTAVGRQVQSLKTEYRQPFDNLVQQKVQLGMDPDAAAREVMELMIDGGVMATFRGKEGLELEAGKMKSPTRVMEDFVEWADDEEIPVIYDRKGHSLVLVDENVTKKLSAYDSRMRQIIENYLEAMRGEPQEFERIRATAIREGWYQSGQPVTGDTLVDWLYKMLSNKVQPESSWPTGRNIGGGKTKIRPIGGETREESLRRRGVR